MYPFYRFSTLFKTLCLVWCCMLGVCWGGGFDVHKDNLGSLKSTLDAYVVSGGYHQDLDRVAQRGLWQLKQIAKHRGHHVKYAIVFDLDETLLSNYAAMHHYGYGGDQAVFDRIVSHAASTLIEPVARLYRFALTHEMAVFFLTGRPDDLTMPTIQNLHRVGILRWQALWSWPRHSIQTIAEFKTAMRAQIEALGYTIALNIGDQQSDLVGGHAQAVLKLPNPFYLIPFDHHRHLTPRTA